MAANTYVTINKFMAIAGLAVAGGGSNTGPTSYPSVDSSDYAEVVNSVSPTVQITDAVYGNEKSIKLDGTTTADSTEFKITFEGNALDGHPLTCKCRLDGGSLYYCGRGEIGDLVANGKLLNGHHMVQVIAIDMSPYRESNPVLISWNINEPPFPALSPMTLMAVDGNGINIPNNGTTSSHTMKFTFNNSPSSSICDLSLPGSQYYNSVCTSPKAFSQSLQ